MRGRGEAGTGTVTGAWARRASAWFEEPLRIIIGCILIFAIGIGFGIAFAVAESGGHPHSKTVVRVDRDTTVGAGHGGSSP